MSKTYIITGIGKGTYNDSNPITTDNLFELGSSPNEDVSDIYHTSLGFNSTNGNLVLSGGDAPTLTSNIDGRYLQLSGGTLSGNLNFSSGALQVGGNKWSFQYDADSRYGVYFSSSNVRIENRGPNGVMSYFTVDDGDIWAKRNIIVGNNLYTKSIFPEGSDGLGLYGDNNDGSGRGTNIQLGGNVSPYVDITIGDTNTNLAGQLNITNRNSSTLGTINLTNIGEINHTTSGSSYLKTTPTEIKMSNGATLDRRTIITQGQIFLGGGAGGNHSAYFKQTGGGDSTEIFSTNTLLVKSSSSTFSFGTSGVLNAPTGFSITGGTSDDVLLGDGTTTSLTGLGSGSGDYLPLTRSVGYTTAHTSVSNNGAFTGMYYSSTSGQNQPPVGNSHIISQSVNSSYTQQIGGRQNRLFFRHQEGGNWNPWLEVATQEWVNAQNFGGGTPINTDNNIAAGIAPGGTITRDPQYATDGDKDTTNYTGFGDSGGQSSTGGTENEYIELDLGYDAQVLNHKIWFYDQDDRYYWYKLKYSNDGVNWLYAVGDASNWVQSDGGKDQPDDIVFTNPISARYWRIYGNGNSTNDSNHLYEWEIYEGYGGGSTNWVDITGDKPNVIGYGNSNRGIQFEDYNGLSDNGRMYFQDGAFWLYGHDGSNHDTILKIREGNSYNDVATKTWVNAQGFGSGTSGSYLPLSGGTMTGNINLDNNYLIFHDNNTSSNIDHIWSDDGANAFHFVHDGSLGDSGNSDMYAGNYYSNGDLVATRSWVNAQGFGSGSGGTWNGGTVTNPTTFDNGQNTTLTIKSDDNGTSKLELYGDSQGTGHVYVGQSTGYGGGIEYNGDDSPGITGAGSDYVTLFRKDNGSYSWTARNKYDSNTWEFRTTPTVGSSLLATRDWVTSQGYGTGSGGTTYNGGIISGTIGRSSHNVGHLEGGYNNVGNSSNYSNPIFTIGSSYNPNSTSLNNMYGIGFGNTDASFINGTDSGATGSGWGMYVASDGNARIFLNSTEGTGYFGGNIFSGGNVVATQDWVESQGYVTTQPSPGVFQGSSITYINLINREGSYYGWNQYTPHNQTNYDIMTHSVGSFARVRIEASTEPTVSYIGSTTGVDINKIPGSTFKPNTIMELIIECVASGTYDRINYFFLDL